jgi:hypothetical protein
LESSSQRDRWGSLEGKSEKNHHEWFHTHYDSKSVLEPPNSHCKRFHILILICLGMWLKTARLLRSGSRQQQTGRPRAVAHWGDRPTHDQFCLRISDSGRVSRQHDKVQIVGLPLLHLAPNGKGMIAFIFCEKDKHLFSSLSPDSSKQDTLVMSLI